ncbi:hypothetical protein HOP50_06g45590 [Chloropicon primus]|uniref:GOLD domain-containing protein n=1 Tax=Chloropicon primus TaxID=1764295 RepID=A0A5B8MMY4_9CHLO|nr:hypothetical protein A3770_06p45360 [Chloropicon primus]UPR01238.1 hypothetical protein HOP50_06g45590 [Chloropicon primus]|eukprot:QDZ22018.1 hypothetical protein A3770_06p45360 [Chloropicon primus]
MAAAEGLVPITREYLSTYYDKYPLDPVTPDAARLRLNLEKLEERLRTDSSVPDLLLRLDEAPKKLDHNNWKNRYACEEIVDLMKRPPSGFSRSSAAATLCEEFQSYHDFIEDFQRGHTERVTNLIYEYLPQDFRGTLIKQQKERSDQKRKDEVAALVSEGCTIKEKYDLLWSQQMAKRESLKGLASASGMFKAVVSFVGGIPQVMLDFLEKINDDNGPLAEQRLRYGPAFYELTTLSNRIHSLVATWWEAAAAEQIPSETEEALLSLVQEASAVYGSELKRVVSFMDEVFANSPFLIKPEGSMDDSTKLNIGAGGKYDATLNVECAGLQVGWQWRVDPGCTIDFDVSFTPKEDGGEAVEVAPLERVGEASGQHTSTSAGDYHFQWSNEFTWLCSKNLEFQIAAVPQEPEGEDA